MCVWLLLGISGYAFKDSSFVFLSLICIYLGMSFDLWWHRMLTNVDFGILATDPTSQVVVLLDLYQTDWSDRSYFSSFLCSHRGLISFSCLFFLLLCLVWEWNIVWGAPHFCFVLSRLLLSTVEVSVFPCVLLSGFRFSLQIIIQSGLFEKITRIWTKLRLSLNGAIIFFFIKKLV